MNTHKTSPSSLPPPVPTPRERFVDTREAAYTMNLPMYYLTNAMHRDKLNLPYYRIGGMIRFKLSELSHWQHQQHQQKHGSPPGGPEHA